MSQIAVCQQECAFFPFQEGKGSKMRRTYSEIERTKSWKNFSLQSTTLSLPFKLPRDSSLPKLLDSPSRNNGTVGRDNLPFEEEKREIWKRDFIGSRGIAFQPRKREYRDSDEPPPYPSNPSFRCGSRVTQQTRD